MINYKCIFITVIKYDVCMFSTVLQLDIFSICLNLHSYKIIINTMYNFTVISILKEM